MSKVLLSQQSNPPLRDVNSKLATGGTYFVRGRWRLSGVESAAGGVSMHGGLAAGLRSLGSLGEVLGVKPVVQVVPGVKWEPHKMLVYIKLAENIAAFHPQSNSNKTWKIYILNS